MMQPALYMENWSDRDVFGDGSDGDVTISSNTTLTRSMYYEKLTVNSGVSLNTGNVRVCVRTSLVNAGTIHANGGNGGAGTNVFGNGQPGGTAGAGNGNASEFQQGAGVSGATKPANPAGTGIAPGGAGGDSDPVFGSAGGAVQAQAGLVFTLTPHLIVSPTVRYTAGGGGGGGGAGQDNGPADPGGTGGGSGAGGGVVWIAAHTIVNTGTISANGGNGGAGGAGTGTGWAAGGGGGGGGGMVFLTYYHLTRGTLSVAGGTGGAGGAGGAGTTTAGADGGAGDLLLWNMASGRWD